MRTTVDIDMPVLRDLKRLQAAEHKTLGRIVSDLLAYALDRRASDRPETAEFRWIARSMGARVDLGDRDAVYAAMDRNPAKRPGRP